MGKPIGVADYQLIVPKEKLQKVLADEIKAFSEEKENDTKNNKQICIYAQKNSRRKPVGNEEFSLPTGLSVFYL